MSSIDVLAEIDTTLEKLVGNAELIRKVGTSTLSVVEIESFQKTQESLLSHLVFLDDLLEEKRGSLPGPYKTTRYKIQEKLLHFSKINKEVVGNLASKLGAINLATRKNRRTLPKKAIVNKILQTEN